MDLEEKYKINFKYNINEYWKLLKKHKKTFTLLIFITLFMNALAIVDKFLFKRIIDDGALFLDGSLAQNIFIQTLTIIAIIYLSVSVGRTIFRWLYIHFINVLDAKLILDLKTHYFSHIIKLSQKFHTTHKTGSLISRLGRGSNAVETMTDAIIFHFTPLLFNLIIVGFSLAYFSIKTAIVVVIMSIIFISYSWKIQQKQQKYKIQFNAATDTEKAYVADIFTNIDTIKYFGKEKLIDKKYKALSTDTNNKFLIYNGFYRWFDAGQLFIIGVSLFFLIYFPLQQFLAGEMTIGTLTFIYTAYSQITMPLFGFVWGLRSFYRAMADFQDLFEYGKIENDIKDKKNAEQIKIQKGGIEFKNVSFNYGKRKAFSLKNFNLKIKPNEKVAFVGHSGCGKTTLVKLLYRLYDVQKGDIKIDNKKITEVKQESLRSEMSIVPQEAILFDDTIYNNVKFANPSATKKEVMQAIKYAQLDKVINKLSQKEKTIVGERGVKLSGGEKQRVSIARAILANKKILILDEATSALDSETEHAIQEALQYLLKGRTSIIIAHRLSTIMNANRIIVMKNGEIIEQGTHNALIRKNGEYKKLWKMQKGGYIK